jgi:hypothetical protein
MVLNSFATNTNDYTFSTSTPLNFNCLINTGNNEANLYINDLSNYVSLPANSNIYLKDLEGINYLRINSNSNFALVCSYKDYSYFNTSSLPENFNNLPYLVYIIGGLLLFFVSLFFIDFLRRTIR